MGRVSKRNVLNLAASLVSSLASKDQKICDKAKLKLRELCYRLSGPGFEAQRRSLSEFLCKKVLEVEKAETRRYILRLIQAVGGEEAVSYLSSLLKDKDKVVRERARRALESNPSQKASDFLLKELENTEDPSWKVALINALGSRKEKKAASVLKAILGEKALEVREAACLALAKIGGPGSCELLLRFRKSSPKKLFQVATVACFEAALEAEREGRKEEALKVYKALSARHEPFHVRMSALKRLKEVSK